MESLLALLVVPRLYMDYMEAYYNNQLRSEPYHRSNKKLRKSSSAQVALLTLARSRKLASCQDSALTRRRHSLSCVHEKSARPCYHGLSACSWWESRLYKGVSWDNLVMIWCYTNKLEYFIFWTFWKALSNFLSPKSVLEKEKKKKKSVWQRSCIPACKYDANLYILTWRWW